MTEEASGLERVDPELWKRRHELLYEIDLSMLYHRKRERIFDSMDRLGKAVAVVGGSAAVAKFLESGSDAGGSSGLLMTLAALIAITSALSLVFGFSERARRHAELAKAFGEVGTQLARAGQTRFDERDLDQCEVKIRSLEATEPASLGALVRICQNEIAIAQGQPDFVSRVRWRERIFAHIWDFPSPARPFPKDVGAN